MRAIFRFVTKLWASLIRGIAWPYIALAMCLWIARDRAALSYAAAPVLILANVFAIGDTAANKGWNGELIPRLAPAAKQQGTYVAKQIRALIEARKPLPAFRYRHLGSLAPIGRKAAVADFGVFKLSGAPAWWLWEIVHVGFMLGVRNRVATLMNWFWAYLRFGGSIRLITGG